MENVVKSAGLWGVEQEIKFPVGVKNGTNTANRKIHYFFNYSDKPREIVYPYNNGNDLLTKKIIQKNSRQMLKEWDFMIVSE